MQRTVVVLRHAHAGDRSAWSGDDACRPLSPFGVSQSLALVDALGPWLSDIERVVTSPTARCRHTVAAIAADRRLPVADVDWLRVGADRLDIARGISAAGSALLCTHGECLRSVLGALGARSLAIVDTAPLLDKAAAWCLRFDGDDLIETTLVAAPVIELDHLAPPLPATG